MGLPEYYNTVLERPSATAPGYDLIHVDVRALQPSSTRPLSLPPQLALFIIALNFTCIVHLPLQSTDCMGCTWFLTSVLSALQITVYCLPQLEMHYHGAAELLRITMQLPVCFDQSFMPKQ